MTTDKLNTSTVNAARIGEQADMAYRPVNRRVPFMRKLGVGEGLQSEFTFKPPTEGEDVVVHTVLIKRAIMGPDADPTEQCLIELETKVDTGIVEKFPLTYLRPETPQVALDMYLSESATVRLMTGKGPVFVIGEYAEEWRDDEQEEVEEDLADEPDEEDLQSEEEAVDDDKENGAAATNGLRGKRKLGENKDPVSAKKRKSDTAEPMEEPVTEKA